MRTRLNESLKEDINVRPIYAFRVPPSLINKENTDLTYYYAPKTKNVNEIEDYYKDAHKDIRKSSVNVDVDYNYSPSVSLDTYTDFNPETYTVDSFREKYAPKDYIRVTYRYAPLSDEVLVYRPSLVTRFKPQPVLVSNTYTLDSYFRFLVQLLSVLR